MRWPWKLLRTPGASPRLFDLSSDPHEQSTLGAHESALDDRLYARLQLRPAQQAYGPARFDRVAVARQDPDRDRIRVPQPPAETLRVRAQGVRLEGPDGVALPADGTPIALASIELPVAPGPVEAGSEPRCSVFHIRPRGVRAADADAELEARLRALGYL